MVKENLFEKRKEYKSHIGKLFGYGTAEANGVNVDTVILCDLIIELLEEVKGLREEIKVVKAEAPKATEEAKAQKAPSKTTK